MKKTPFVDATLIALAALAVLLSLGGGFMPGWVRYLTQVSLATTLAAVGVMILLRAGLLTFGQGLYYFIGAYSVPLLQKHLGVSDILLATVVGTMAAVAVAAVAGLFTSRYRGIFFSMLTLAISMVVYGIAVKSPLFGGSDGLNVRGASLVGESFSGEKLQWVTYFCSVWIAALYMAIAHLLLRSRLGKTAEALEQNEVRLDYLGVSPKWTVYAISLFSASLGAAGGTLAALSARHVDPSFAYWTTAGEFVFIVLLGGQRSVLGPLVGAVLLEVMRIVSSSYFPDQWQMLLGAMMLLIILFLPAGAASIGGFAFAFVRRVLGGGKWRLTAKGGARDRAA